MESMQNLNIKAGTFNMCNIECESGTQFFGEEGSTRCELLRGATNIWKQSDFNIPREFYRAASTFEKPIILNRFSVCSLLTEDTLDALASFAVRTGEPATGTEGSDFVTFAEQWKDHIGREKLQARDSTDIERALKFDYYILCIFNHWLSCDSTHDTQSLSDDLRNLKAMYVLNPVEAFKMLYRLLWNNVQGDVKHAKATFINEMLRCNDLNVLMVQESAFDLESFNDSGVLHEYNIFQSPGYDQCFIVKKGFDVTIDPYIDSDPNDNDEDEDPNGADWRSAMLIATVTGQGGQIVKVCNLHLTSKGDGTRALAQLGNCIRYVKRHLSQQLCVFGGDFNLGLDKVNEKLGICLHYEKTTSTKERTPFQPQANKIEVIVDEVKDYLMWFSEGNFYGNIYVGDQGPLSDHCPVFLI